ncbi:hypothetical protein OXX59_007763 [Metschnikowia pulcherrima]
MSITRPNSSRAKSLPMIVDVAVDPQGKTLYRVHETTSALQEATPLSSNYSDSSRHFFDSLEELHSPAGSVSSTQSPCSDKQKTFELGTLTPLEMPERRSSVSRNTGYCAPSSEDIWSSDVEAAFEEALAIVPKCGLTKIKIAGKCCGRNELIADFILAKTGKFRSRKQVSSHIQVVKNMKSKENLINLINDGPDYSSPEEAEENMKRFEEVFSKININKSLGLNSTGDAELSGSGGSLRRRSSEQLTLPPKRKKSPSLSLNVRDISFTIENPDNNGYPVTLTTQAETPMKFLSVKENANITTRFPGLEEFSNTNVPLIHNMVNIMNPLKLATTHSIDVGLKTNFKVDIPGARENLACFTTVYSFGDEVLKVNDDDFRTNTDQPFLVKFWKCFFLQLLNLPTSLDAAFKGVTVKQVIYDNTVPITSILPKSKIKAVLLWEFSKVDEFSEAVSSSSRLFLPPALGYATMTANNSNYSIRPPQQTYPLSQPPTEPSNAQFMYTPASSTSSLRNLANNKNYKLPEISRPTNSTGVSQLSFPGLSVSSPFYEQQATPQYSASILPGVSLMTPVEGESNTFFPAEEQHVLGNYLH